MTVAAWRLPQGLASTVAADSAVPLEDQTTIKTGVPGGPAAQTRGFPALLLVLSEPSETITAPVASSTTVYLMPLMVPPGESRSCQTKMLIPAIEAWSRPTFQLFAATGESTANWKWLGVPFW